MGFSADVKYALRSFARRPVFTAAILLTLALGIGSNVAIFSVANAILFRPLPYADPDELVLVWTRLPDTDVARNLVSPPDFGDYQKEARLFATVPSHGSLCAARRRLSHDTARDLGFDVLSSGMSSFEA